MDTKQRDALVKNISYGLWTLSDADYNRLIATLQTATTDEQVNAVRTELDQIDPPMTDGVEW